MHYPATILENDTHKLQWDFDIHTDHLISTRTRKIVDFAVPADYRIKLKECERRISTLTFLEN